MPPPTIEETIKNGDVSKCAVTDTEVTATTDGKSIEETNETTIDESVSDTIEKTMTEKDDFDEKMQVDDSPVDNNTVEAIKTNNDDRTVEIKTETIKTEDNSEKIVDSANTTSSPVATGDIVKSDESIKVDVSNGKDDSAKDDEIMQVDAGPDTLSEAIVESKQSSEAVAVATEEIKKKETIADVPKVDQLNGGTNGTSEPEVPESVVDEKNDVVAPKTDTEEKTETKIENEIKEVDSKIDDNEKVDFKMDEPKVLVGEASAIAEPIQNENKIEIVNDAVATAAHNGDNNDKEAIIAETNSTESKVITETINLPPATEHVERMVETANLVATMEIEIEKSDPIVKMIVADETVTTNVTDTANAKDKANVEVVVLNVNGNATESSSNGNSVEEKVEDVPVKIHHIVVTPSSEESSTIDVSISSPTIIATTTTTQQQKTEVSEVIETNSETSKEKVSRVEITIEKIDKQPGQTTQTTTHIVKEISITEQKYSANSTKTDDADKIDVTTDKEEKMVVDTVITVAAAPDEKKTQNGNTENGMSKLENDSDKENDVDESMITSNNVEDVPTTIPAADSDETLKKCSDLTTAVVTTTTTTTKTSSAPPPPPPPTTEAAAIIEA